LIPSRPFRDMIRRGNDDAHLHGGFVPLTTISTCRLAQQGADQPLAPIERRRRRTVSLCHFAGVGLDLVLTTKRMKPELWQGVSSNGTAETTKRRLCALVHYCAIEGDDAVGHADTDTPARPPRLSIDLGEDLLADFRIATAHWSLAQQFDKRRH
jgi:hypothetical protein